MMKIEEVVVEFLGCGHGVSVVALVWRFRYCVTPSDVWWRKMFRITTDLEEGDGLGDIYIQYVRGTDSYLHTA